MRARWLQWKLAQDQAADLNYVVHGQFASDLEVMGGGTSINIAQDSNVL
jgi:hypothetical protein